MADKRRGAVGFWSFIFSAVLVLFHAYLLDSDHSGLPFLFGRGSLAAEFFFVTAGCLMAERVNAASKEPSGRIGTWTYIGERIGSIYPAFFISWAVTFAAVSAVFFKGFSSLCKDLLSSIVELTFLRNIGLDGYRALPQVWFLSGLVIALFVLYPLYRSNKKRFEYFIAPVLAIFLLGYLYYKTGTLNDTGKYMHFGLKSTYRAVGEVALGAVCYMLASKLNGRRLGRAGVLLISVAEVACYTAAILYMQFPGYFPHYFDYLALVCIAAGAVMTFSGRSAVGRILSGRACVWLGRFSLYPMLMLALPAKLIPKLMPGLSPLKAELIYLAATYALALLLMLAEKTFRKLLGCLKRAMIKSKE